jgi:superfamily II DNA/RNA helicase
MPANPEDYIHRIGRTGRAGATGEAISLLAPEDRDKLSAIERLIKRKLSVQVAPPVASHTRPERRERSQRAERPHRFERSRPAADPLFSRPYQPSPESSAPSPQESSDKKPQKQIAALFLPPAKQDV